LTVSPDLKSGMSPLICSFSMKSILSMTAKPPDYLPIKSPLLSSSALISMG
jgi:hypothetical protein